MSLILARSEQPQQNHTEQDNDYKIVMLLKYYWEYYGWLSKYYFMLDLLN